MRDVDKDESAWLETIRRIFRGACADTFVDDGADLPPVPKGHTRVITSDVLVEDVHFSLSFASPESAGHRALVQNLSDLAAMAATPVGFQWTLAVPRRWRRGPEDESPLTAFLRGAARAAHTYRFPILGGDLSSTTGPLSCSITALGDAKTPRPRRDGAQIGDRLFVGRPIGQSATGLRLLRSPVTPSPSPSSSSSSEKEGTSEAIDAHLWPAPQLELGRCLGSLATSMMDISDGLALDLWRLVEASQCGARLHGDWYRCCGPGASVDDALFGGEDYALLFSLPASVPLEERQRAESSDGRCAAMKHAIEIGVVVDSAPSVCFFDGTRVPRRGYDHLVPAQVRD